MKCSWKHILVAAAAVWAFTACTDDSYRGFEQDYNDYTLPLTVQIAVGDPYVKGSGPVNDLNGFEDKEILVWAYRSDEPSDYSAVRTETDSLTCLINERAAILDGTNSLAAWKDGDVFYPCGEFSGVYFDFFAAYVDDVKTNRINRNRDWVTLDIEIDGSQDLMVSKANLPVQKDGEVKDYAFSYLSALDGDDPIFTMHHSLVRIDLWLMPGITQSLSHTTEVSNVTLTSKKDAKMTVVSKDPEELGVVFGDNAARAELALTEEDGSPLKPVKITTIEGSPLDEELIEIQRQMAFQLGGSFFVAPDKEYPLLLDVLPTEQLSEDTPKRKRIVNTVALTSGGDFLPGNRYQVLMTVYGMYVMVVDIQMVPWNFAGGFLLDPQTDTELEELNVYCKDVTVGQGSAVTLEPTILLTGADGQLAPATRSDVTFSYESQDEAVVTVDETGVVTGVSPGKTTVVVTAVRKDADGDVVGLGQRAVRVTVTE